MRRAIVAGGSMAGLFAALLLRRRGWDVQVCERVRAPLSGRGAGIVTHAALWRAMAAAGVAADAGAGVHVQGRVTLARDGSVEGTFRCPQVMTGWDQVFRMLRAAWPDERYGAGQEVVGAATDAAGVAVRFADGSVRRAELLVGADGIRSAVRGACIGAVPARYAGYAAWRGLLAEAEMPAAAHAALFEHFGFCLPPGEQMLGYPVAGEDNDLRPGRRRYNFVWYRPAAAGAALERLLTDATGRVHEGSIPPPLIRPDVVAEMRAAAEAVLAPPFAALVRAVRQPFLQPVYDLETPRMVAGRVALVGDSAFVARPHMGAGVTKAAEDAMALAACLESGPVPEALLRYEAERAPAGRRIVQRARDLGAYLQAEQASAAERDAAARHRTAAAVMAETALLTPA